MKEKHDQVLLLFPDSTGISLAIVRAKPRKLKRNDRRCLILHCLFDYLESGEREVWALDINEYILGHRYMSIWYRLMELMNAGLLNRQRKGRRMYYSLTETGMRVAHLLEQGKE